MKYITLFYESGGYHIGFQLSSSETTRMRYSFEKELFKRLVEAYKTEGVEVKNGNLEEKIFDEITK
jgi:hypothetical protein